MGFCDWPNTLEDLVHANRQEALWSRRLPDPEIDWQGHIWTGLPSTQEGYWTDLRHEGAVEEGHCPEEGGRTHAGRTKHPRTDSDDGVTIHRWSQVFFPNAHGSVLGHGLYVRRRAVLALAKRGTL